MPMSQGEFILKAVDFRWVQLVWHQQHVWEGESAFVQTWGYFSRSNVRKKCGSEMQGSQSGRNSLQ